jgi:hypothetical protein
MYRALAITLTVLIGTTAPPVLAEIGERDGWQIVETEMAHATLLERLLAAVPEEGMGVVTQAGPTGAARARGIDGVPPLKWSTNWGRFAPSIGGPGDGWEAREAGRHRDEAAAG